MRNAPLAVACAPVRESNPARGRIPVRIEITNRSDREVVIPSVAIPWESFYAAEFAVKNVRGFRRALPESVPRELPDTRIPPGGSVHGEVNLAGYLHNNAGAGIAELPGEYVVEATVDTSVAAEGGGFRRLRLRCEPFTVRITDG